MICTQSLVCDVDTDGICLEWATLSRQMLMRICITHCMRVWCTSWPLKLMPLYG